MHAIDMDDVPKPDVDDLKKADIDDVPKPQAPPSADSKAHPLEESHWGGAPPEDPEDGLPPPDAPKKAKVKFLLKEYAAGSTAHGVPHVAEDNTLCARLVWIFLLIICFIAFCFLFYDTITSYLKFETNVVIEMQVAEGKFPAVTVCNLSPYKLSGLKNNPQTKPLVAAYEYMMTVKRRQMDGDLSIVPDSARAYLKQA